MPLGIHNLLRDGRSGGPVAGTAILVVLMIVISECTFSMYVRRSDITYQRGAYARPATR
jgi:hypothetical protein